MGLTLENLSEEELCELMCGRSEEDIYDDKVACTAVGNSIVDN